jgi:chorismate mutase
MYVRGIRGATTVHANTEQEIVTHTIALLNEIVAQNELSPEDIASLMITVTEDITAAFPAKAIRQMPNWELVPLMCALEIPVPGSLELCIRMLLTVNTTKKQTEINHVYLNGAVRLRPDLKPTAG